MSFAVYLYIYELCSFSNLFVTSPTLQLILQPFCCFTYITTHSPALPLLHLHHSSFSNPSFASPTSQALHLIHLASRPCSKPETRSVTIAAKSKNCLMCYQGVQGVTFTLVVELFPPRLRTAVGVILELYWTVGLVYLASASYYIPNWRTLQLVLSIPTAVTLLYVW